MREFAVLEWPPVPQRRWLTAVIDDPGDETVYSLLDTTVRLDGVEYYVMGIYVHEEADRRVMRGKPWELDVNAPSLETFLDERLVEAPAPPEWVDAMRQALKLHRAERPMYFFGESSAPEPSHICRQHCLDEAHDDRAAWPCPTVRTLAAAFCTHPDYRADLWTPEGVEVTA